MHMLIFLVLIVIHNMLVFQILTADDLNLFLCIFDSVAQMEVYYLFVS